MSDTILSGGHRFELWWDQKGRYYKCAHCGAILGQDRILCTNHPLRRGY